MSKSIYDCGTTIIELMDRKRYDEAIRACERAYEYYPGSALISSLLADAYYNSGNPEAAVDAAQRAVKHDPREFGAHLILAYVLRDAGDLVGSLIHLKDAKIANPESSLVLVATGDIYRALGDIDTSIRCFADALRLDKSDPFARQRLADLLDDQDLVDAV